MELVAIGGQYQAVAWMGIEGERDQAHAPSMVSARQGVNTRPATRHKLGAMTSDLSHEAAVRAAIERWREQPPGWGTRLLARPGQAAALAAQRLVPVSALRAALRGVDQAAGRLASPRDILREAGVVDLAGVAVLPLASCDRLARRVERRSMALAGGSGAVFGSLGLVGMAVDVPGLLTLALRHIHRTAYCYGEDWTDPAQRGLALGVFALASANSLDEKRAAWTAVQDHGELLDAAWRDGIERIAERELAKESAQFSLQLLASRIGTQLGQRKAAGAVPLLGSAIGAAVNAGYIHDLGLAARYVLQDRWLRRRAART